MEFDPKKLRIGAAEVRTIHVPGIGEVRYKELTVAQAIEVSKAKSVEERAKLMLWYYLKDQYPGELTDPSIIMDWSDIASGILLEAISNDVNFHYGKLSRSGATTNSNGSDGSPASSG